MFKYTKAEAEGYTLLWETDGDEIYLGFAPEAAREILANNPGAYPGADPGIGRKMVHPVTVVSPALAFV